MQKNSLVSILSKKTDTINPTVVVEVDGKYFRIGGIEKVNMLTVAIVLGEEIKTESKEQVEKPTDPEELAKSQMPEVPENLTPEQEEVLEELKAAVDAPVETKSKSKKSK